MKKSDISKLKEKAVPELEKELASTREKVAELRVSVYRGKHSDVPGLREARRKVARILTFLKQNQHGGK
jgi:ribosomal protein L29